MLAKSDLGVIPDLLNSSICEKGTAAFILMGLQLADEVWTT